MTVMPHDIFLTLRRLHVFRISTESNYEIQHYIWVFYEQIFMNTFLWKKLH